MLPKEQLRVCLLDLATLLFHVHRGSQLEDVVGFEDADRTLQQLTKELSPMRARITTSALESGLWSCNLMDEAGEWWSPTNESFEQFISRVLRYASDEQRLEFDKRFNLLRKQAPVSK